MMRFMRTPDEVLTDEVITLCLLSEAERVSREPVDRLRLQKYCFLVGYRWFQERRKGLNYTFFRYRHGPFTRDLYQTEMDLATAGLIACGQDWSLSLTPSGHELAEDLIEATVNSGENSAFWQDIASVLAEYALLSTPELLRAVYELEVMPVGWREAWPLEDIPHGVDLTRILEEWEATAVLELDPGWLDTFGATIASVAPADPEAVAHALVHHPGMR